MTTAILDRLKANYLTQQLNQSSSLLDKGMFWWVVNAADVSKKLMLYDTQTRLLWDANPGISNTYSLENGKIEASKLTFGSLKGWVLPSQDELWNIAGKNGFPLHQGSNRQILDRYGWLCSTGYVDMNNNNFNPYGSGYVLCCNRRVAQQTKEQFLQFCLTQQWDLISCENPSIKPLLSSFSPTPKLSELYPSIDYLRARLPQLESAQFTDPAKGLWEFWGMEASTLATDGSRARNPAQDVRDWNVAIDFGTSSTVVAYSENGQAKLLRIGVKDFWVAQQPKDYENPTVLEFIDFQALLHAWQEEAYQPLVSWDDVRCSHEALGNLRNNETDASVVASILGKIKQWALRENGDIETIITDKAGLVYKLAPLSLMQPVKGEPLSVNGDYPFDPIELYAWYLGLTINWRGRGIFLRYYMTFPVAYPVDVKEKILASFRRGLQRSLPATLVGQAEFHKFTVEERASEPAAYAVAALPELGIEPTKQGVAYAVFDFGGGTADFDFGFYRLPTDEEEDVGTEVVLEHFGSAGDCFLGGENLLENMAYRLFKHNLDVCRDKKIAFTRPLDADDFAGSEMFLQKTQAALTNSLMIMSKLRPLWETGKSTNSSGVEKIQLINRDGEKVMCELTVPEEELREYLEQRIEQGVINFFFALRKAFADNLPKTVHILLAGNASRSIIVKALFGLLKEDYLDMADTILSEQEKLFGSNCPEFTVHPPLPMDDQNVYKPTGKTGVALGLLKLCPGSSVEVINRAAPNSFGEAPFAFYVGRIYKQYFQPSLNQGAAYQEWHEIGPYRENVFNLVYSQSPKAHTGMMQDGEAGLIYKRLDFVGANNGKLFARIIAPDSIQLCTAASIESLHSGLIDNVLELKL